MSATTARYHSDWLQLVEIAGPFLSLPVLVEEFPTGLELVEVEQRRQLRQAFQEWEAEPELHLPWIEWVLQTLLGFENRRLGAAVLRSQADLGGLGRWELPEQGETLQADWGVISPEGQADAGQVRLLVQMWPRGQALERTVAGRRWQASPISRMLTLLQGTEVPLGLVTNGEEWALVYAPRGVSSSVCTWRASLWTEEPVTLQAFVALLRVQRFFSVGTESTLPALLARSAANQQEVTDKLGLQVRQAVEVLVQAFDRLDAESDRQLLAGVAESQLYEACLTVMMRLVFLFAAEERGLLPLGQDLYDHNYAVSVLGEQLRQRADRVGEEVLERHSDAWGRLLATFRAVHGGVQHHQLRLVAYGGSLFDPDRYPFLEGRPEGSHWRETAAQPVRINNRVTLHLLEALQLLNSEVGKQRVRRRLSFKGLDVEQIGHVYEGLLDHTAKRAETTILGLAGNSGQEPELALSQLEQWRAEGLESLVQNLAKLTKRSANALQKALDPNSATGKGRRGTVPTVDEGKLWLVCGQDVALLERVKPFAPLLRLDSLGYPVVIRAGSVFMTEGSDRRSTGTHYTPRSLAEEIVLHSLEPLVYEGVAEGLPREQWQLKSAEALLNLKVADIAMGSGAFLVAACRYLGDRLLEAWARAEATPSETSDTLPSDAEERQLLARRLIADRCLYGVDVNPMAVEMAKLSLWLLTLQKDRPFTFLDHALKCGDSLLGVSQAQQLAYFDLRPQSDRPIAMIGAVSQPLIAQARQKRQELESFTVQEPRDLERKASLLLAAEAEIEQLRLIGDLLVGEALASSSAQSDPESDVVAETIASCLLQSSPDHERQLAAFRDRAQRLLNLDNPKDQPRRPFHWPLEFPEVIESGGFDAIIGNPPFVGGKKITGSVGTDYRHFLVEIIANGQRGNADLCSYFFLRSASLLQNNGHFGLIATNTIAQGDTREVGLDQLVQAGSLYRALPSTPWPGDAALEVAHCWYRKGTWANQCWLNGQPVSGISAFLSEPNQVAGNPYRLAANAGKSFQGSIVLGKGFVLEPEEAAALIAKDPRNREVLFPYLNGEDLNSRPDQSPSRWVINFFDWPLDAAHDDPKEPKGPPYAADYPDCLAIIEERVKPERTRVNEEGEFVLRKPLPHKWWIYADKRPALYQAIAECDRVLCRAITGIHHAFAFIPVNIVIDQTSPVYIFEDYTSFAILQSDLNNHWAWANCSTMRQWYRYTPTDGFQTFPFPDRMDELEAIGEAYYSHRQALMQHYQEGLTKIYNRFHKPQETDPAVQKLRDLQIEMDEAVAAAYGWSDLVLGHGFHETKQGLRFTISEAARREVLDRLLALNHQRYAEEVAAGLHNKGTKGKSSGKGGRKKKVEEVAEVVAEQGSFF